MKNEIVIDSTAGGDMSQVDTYLDQMGRSIRSGQWKTVVSNIYSEDGKRLLSQTITTEYVQPEFSGLTPAATDGPIREITPPKDY